MILGVQRPAYFTKKSNSATIHQCWAFHCIRDDTPSKIQQAPIV